MNNVTEENLAKKNEEIREFISKAEQNLSAVLKREIRGLKSQVKIQLFGNQVKIFFGLTALGVGDVVLLVEAHDSKSKKTGKAYSIKGILMSGIHYDFENPSDKDALITAGKLTMRLGEFGNKVKEYVSTYNENYEKLTKASDLK